MMLSSSSSIVSNNSDNNINIKNSCNTQNNGIHNNNNTINENNQVNNYKDFSNKNYCKQHKPPQNYYERQSAKLSANPRNIRKYYSNANNGYKYCQQPEQQNNITYYPASAAKPTSYSMSDNNQNDEVYYYPDYELGNTNSNYSYKYNRYYNGNSTDYQVR